MGFVLYLVLLASCGGGKGSGSSTVPTPPPAGGNFLQDAGLGVTTLETWYDQGTGLWQTTGWWNAANALTVLIQYSRLSSSSQYQSVVSNTFTQAQNTNAGFINNYYDDEGWWALAWIAAYDWTGNSTYLNTAQQIFSDMTTGWDATCGGAPGQPRDRPAAEGLGLHLG